MRHVVSCALVLLLCLTVGFVHAQGRNVKIRATEVADGIYMLEGQGGNIGLSIGADGVFMIDDQFAPLADKIRAKIEELGGEKVDYLLNTHHHGDHTGGNAAFGGEASILAHENVRGRLQKGGRGGPAPPEALPVLTFRDSVTLHFNGEDVRILHLPTGHTDGDCMVHFPAANVAHMGDHFFSGRLPFVDLDSGGDVLGYTRNVETALEILPEGVKIIPGHGPLSTKDDLRKFHRMLEETTEHVKKQMDGGKRFEKIRSGGLPEEWKSWGAGFVTEERWIEFVYKSLKRAR